MAQNISVSIPNDLLEEVMDHFDCDGIDDACSQARNHMRNELEKEVNYD